ncbi:MAG: Crp/Fnr family transcriptional regulator [Gammaproteobacteria bacterium]|nr:Crp/Fnr family transcriptional regulator [Gammaproteobacteria bacterium]
MLEKVPLFCNLNAQELTLIEQRAVSRSYPKNSIIINEGEDAISLYVILSGRVKTFMNNPQGKEIILSTLGPGNYFGELALIDDAPRSASVMTTADSTLMVINKPAFQELLESHPNLSLALLKNLARQVRLLTDNVKSLALLDVYGRLARMLLQLAEERNGQLVIDQRLTQQEIANRIGSSREMVARILGDLTTGGYITITNKRITLNERLPKAY